MAIITISRGSHAGGKAVAELVGQRLGQPVLGREEVLTEAAQAFGTLETELTASLDDSPRFWQQVPGKRLAYAKSVAAVLLDRASDSNLIYHGNVGHLLLYGVDWEDPSQYSVVLNLSELSPADACETIVRMTELASFQSTPEGAKALEDQRLGCRVWAALAKNPVTRSAGIDVTADGGHVVIQGSVSSENASDLLPQLAGEVDGVESVRSEVGTGSDWYW